jgi:hypothetical protein
MLAAATTWASSTPSSNAASSSSSSNAAAAWAAWASFGGLNASIFWQIHQFSGQSAATYTKHSECPSKTHCFSIALIFGSP